MTIQTWPSFTIEADSGAYHPVPVSSFLSDALAKSCSMYASGFPDLRHLDLWLLSVLLSMCTLQQEIQLQSSKGVEEHSTKTIKEDGPSTVLQCGGLELTLDGF